MCPIFQCLVCLCEIFLSSYKPIMHFKHSYMHNHAFYVLIHPIILLYHTYMLHIQLSTAKFNTSFNSPTSIPNHVNCQIRSNFQSQFQFQLSNSKQFPISNVNSNLNFNVKLSNSTQCQLSNSKQSQLQ